ncbi:hypothetical protein [Nitrincola iocasae]|uniref:DUF4139 domain-containing protein n=1 Tax=Nitrincola iocasae TaxID=2614693 RepID=A0A5J6LFR8_9GAMM|nr:hypothetical protein [Nitrincola iocasae]QEW07196.1 hypothetical protein F5I99_12150 [Nitrincola iocasae]
MILPPQYPAYLKRCLPAVSIMSASFWVVASLSQSAWASQTFPEAVLPIERVVLSTSGVGLFQQGGKVDGPVQVQLQASSTEMNDLLKSLVFWDQGNGRILGVSYPGQSALDRTLSSLRVDLSGNPGWVEVFTQLRGQAIQVETLQGSLLTGRILGADRRTLRVADQFAELDYLNLVTETGLESLSLDQIRRFELTDTRLQADLNRALNALAQDRHNERKAVNLYLEGEGERDVAVTYVAAAPVWKTSYRLLLNESDSKAASLQTWALVENASDQDWQNISLALISGRPLSFIEDLYQSRFIDRPVYESVAFEGIAPQAYALARGAALDEEFVPLRAVAAAPMRAPAPSMESAPKAGSMASVEGQDLGSHFEYRLENVSLSRQQSAMLPILNASVEIAPVSIYDTSVHPRHPLRGAYLANTSDKPLPEGPMTVMMGQSYVGDARIDHIPPGAKRLISYAVDLDLQVLPQTTQQETQLTQGKIEQGVLMLQQTRQRETVYHAINESAQDRNLVIVHPRQQGWELESDAERLEQTEEHYRLAVDLLAHSEQPVLVKEVKIDWEHFQLAALSETQLFYWSSQAQLSVELKSQVERAASLRQAWSRAERSLQDRKGAIESIYQEQARIRANLEVLEPGSALYQRLVNQLSEQEDELHSLNASVKQAEAEVHLAREAFETFIAQL